jgi:hypothetical protein
MSFEKVSVALLGALAMVIAPACNSDHPKLVLGEGCVLNSDCTDPLVCKLVRCHRACVQTRDCPSGEPCVKVDGIGACQLASEQKCGPTRSCAGGLVCDTEGDQCRSPCANDQACLVAQMCTRGVCVDRGTQAAAACMPPPAGMTGRNNGGELTGAVIGSGKYSNDKLVKALKVTVVTPNPDLEVIGAYALGPGPSLAVALTVKVRGPNVVCGVSIGTATISDGAGGLLVRNGLGSGVYGSVVDGGRASGSCLGPGETGFGQFSDSSNGSRDFFSAASQIEIETVTSSCGKVLPGLKIAPTSYSVTPSGELEVTFKNVGTIDIGVPQSGKNFSTYLLLDDTGRPLGYGGLSSRVRAPAVLRPGDIGVVVDSVPRFEGQAKRMLVNLYLVEPGSTTP